MKIYDYYWLESYSKHELKRVFAKKIPSGWEGWATGETLPHAKMIQMYVTIWIEGLWHAVSEEYATAEIEAYCAELERIRRSTKTW